MRDPSTSTVPRLLDTRDLADIIGVSTAAIYTRHCRGQIPKAMNIGGSLRWHPDTINRWLDALAEAAK